MNPKEFDKSRFQELLDLQTNILEKVITGEKITEYPIAPWAQHIQGALALYLQVSEGSWDGNRLPPAEKEQYKQYFREDILDKVKLAGLSIRIKQGLTQIPLVMHRPNDIDISMAIESSPTASAIILSSQVDSSTKTNGSVTELAFNDQRVVTIYSREESVIEHVKQEIADRSVNADPLVLVSDRMSADVLKVANLLAMSQTAQPNPPQSDIWSINFLETYADELNPIRAWNERQLVQRFKNHDDKLRSMLAGKLNLISPTKLPDLKR